MLPALFVAVPVAELVVLFFLQDYIGWPVTLSVVLVTGLLGAYLVRRQGSAAYAAIRDTFQQGVFPGKEMAHAALVLVGGAFLLTPGFLTDVVGFSLMVAPVREFIRVRAMVKLRNRVIP